MPREATATSTFHQMPEYDDPWHLGYTLISMSKRTSKRKLSKKKKANHGKKPNCGRG